MQGRWIEALPPPSSLQRGRAVTHWRSRPAEERDAEMKKETRQRDGERHVNRGGTETATGASLDLSLLLQRSGRPAAPPFARVWKGPTCGRSGARYRDDREILIDSTRRSIRCLRWKDAESETSREASPSLAAAPSRPSVQVQLRISPDVTPAFGLAPRALRLARVALTETQHNLDRYGTGTYIHTCQVPERESETKLAHRKHMLSEARPSANLKAFLVSSRDGKKKKKQNKTTNS